MQNETPRHKGKQEERQAGRQDRRQDLGKADTPSNTKADTLRKPTPNSTLSEKIKNQTTHHKGKQEEKQVGRQAGRQEGRQAGRQAGRQGRQNLGKADTPSNTGNKKGDNGRQWETLGDSGRHWETVGDNGRQELGKADAPSNTGTHVGRQWETNGDKTSGRRARHPTQAHVWGDNGGQGLLKADIIQGGDTIQHRHQCGQTMGDNGGRQDLGRRSHHPAQVHMWGDSGKQWHTTGDKGKRGDKKGDNGRQLRGQWRQWKKSGDKTSGRWTNHRTQAHM